VPRVKLKIPAWLIQGVKFQLAAFYETYITVAELGSIIEELHSLPQGRRILQSLLKDKTFGIILNGVYVNPEDPSENQLKEGDEVTFIPLLDGG